MKDPEVDRIGDFIGPDPPDGYGPYRVLKVREKADPTDNADNFRWFASEAYWHTICRPGLGQYGAGREEKMCNGAEGGGEMDLAERCHPI